MGGLCDAEARMASQEATEMIEGFHVALARVLVVWGEHRRGEGYIVVNGVGYEVWDAEALLTFFQVLVGRGGFVVVAPRHAMVLDLQGGV